jgi:hypothetical protein
VKGVIGIVAAGVVLEGSAIGRRVVDTKVMLAYS